MQSRDRPAFGQITLHTYIIIIIIIIIIVIIIINYFYAIYYQMQARSLTKENVLLDCILNNCNKGIFYIIYIYIHRERERERERDRERER